MSTHRPGALFDTTELELRWAAALDLAVAEEANRLEQTMPVVVFALVIDGLSSAAPARPALDYLSPVWTRPLPWPTVLARQLLKRATTLAVAPGDLVARLVEAGLAERGVGLKDVDRRACGILGWPEPLVVPDGPRSRASALAEGWR